MHIDWDASIAMDDGVVLRADVFRPSDERRHPVILSYGPYAKGLSFQEGYKSNWARLTKAAPEVLEGSSNKYQCWELVDPEKWVPDGYVCVRVDSRGAGRSPGVIDIWSAREARDLYHCIEWAAARAASSPASRSPARGRSRQKCWQRTPLIQRAKPCAARSWTITTEAAWSTSGGSRRLCSPPPTGAGRACIRAATMKASSPPARRRSGSRCTATRTSPTSTATTAWACRSASSAAS